MSRFTSMHFCLVGDCQSKSPKKINLERHIWLVHLRPKLDGFYVKYLPSKHKHVVSRYVETIRFASKRESPSVTITNTTMEMSRKSMEDCRSIMSSDDQSRSSTIEIQHFEEHAYSKKSYRSTYDDSFASFNEASNEPHRYAYDNNDIAVPASVETLSTFHHYYSAQSDSDNSFQPEYTMVESYEILQPEEKHVWRPWQ